MSKDDPLPDDLEWRYMEYDPAGTDFTWEREWRIKKDPLELDPQETLILVKTRDEKRVLNKLIKEKSGSQPWTIIPLDFLGL